MIICHFWLSIVKNNEHWLLDFKNSVWRGFLVFGSNWKLFLVWEKK
jgi:hypothetical protein